MKIGKYAFYNLLLIVGLASFLGCAAWSYLESKKLDDWLGFYSNVGHDISDLNSEILGLQYRTSPAVSPLTQEINRLDVLLESRVKSSTLVGVYMEFNDSDLKVNQFFYEQSKHLLANQDRLVSTDIGLQYVKTILYQSVERDIYTKQNLAILLAELLGSDSKAIEADNDGNTGPHVVHYYELKERAGYLTDELLTATNFSFIHNTEEHYIGRINYLMIQALIFIALSFGCFGGLFYRQLYRSYIHEHRANIKLNEARRKAEAASEAKSVFLATMSHELRTPMNGVLGMAQILKAQISNQQQSDILKTIIDSGNHFVTILNDILDYSKSENEKIEYQREPFVIDALVAPIKATYGPICEEKSIKFVSNIE
ncbi:histidine kinase dimerization/phospho-acceptor domain-containing protein, partial [Vibrio sp. FNV 38]|nr:histidine kinase dimerization/phospho-acceptor domain-containing protein [Vibrio sp. FNV 38]